MASWRGRKKALEGEKELEGEWRCVRSGGAGAGGSHVDHGVVLVVHPGSNRRHWRGGVTSGHLYPRSLGSARPEFKSWGSLLLAI